MNGNPPCQEPRCNAPATETYTGEHGNRLKLCDKHYYNLVANNCGTITNTSGSVMHPSLCNTTISDVDSSLSTDYLDRISRTPGDKLE